MRRIIGVLLVSLLCVGGAAVPAQAVASCGSTSICGYDNPNNLPRWGFSETITRNVCHSVPADVTTYIDNNTPVQWRVYTGPGCTGLIGTIYANTEGYMGGSFYRTIDSVSRTSSP